MRFTKFSISLVIGLCFLLAFLISILKMMAPILIPVLIIGAITWYFSNKNKDNDDIL